MREAVSVGAFVMGVLVAAAPPASAGMPTDQLRDSVGKVLKLVDPQARRESGPERRAALRRIADDIFDWEETARRSLGLHWQQRTPAERAEFVRLFADLLERSYLAKIEAYDGEQFGFLGDSIDGEQAIVRTRLVNRRGQEMGINYRMRRHDGDRWKVYDVEIEGISLVNNYRTQFASVLRRTPYAEMVRALRAKVAEPETAAAMASPRTR